jgi:hypothetical protein
LQAAAISCKVQYRQSDEETVLERDWAAFMRLEVTKFSSDSMATRGKPRVIGSKDPELAKLEELQSLIVNPDDVGEPLANPDFPNRKLLHKGALDRVLPTGVVEDGVVILLSDLLIYCLEDAHGMLTVDGVIEMQTGASVKAANQLADNVNLHVLNVLSSEGYGYTFVAEDAGNQQARAESVSFLPHC